MTRLSTPPGFPQALRLFHEASRRVPAYRDFLKQRGIDPAQVKTFADWKTLPTMSKDNYVRAYPLEQLCWDGRLDGVWQLPLSSGTSGRATHWPTLPSQNVVSGRIIHGILAESFGAKTRSTLFAITFGLGGWKAGLEFYEAVRWAASNGLNVTVITPGLELSEIIKQVKAVGGQFDQLVIAGYPPFVRDILAVGREEGIDWRALDTKAIVAGEAISEAWRTRLLHVAGLPNEPERIIGLYGMAEVGAIAHETTATIHLRRTIDVDQPLWSLLGGPAQTGLFQYDPRHRFIELADDDSSLLLSAHAGVPLIRYVTPDQGGLMPFHAVARHASLPDATQHNPFVYLAGRIDSAVSLYAVGIYPENIKAGLELAQFEHELSGFFTMEVASRADLSQSLQITIELAQGKTSSPELKRSIKQHIVAALRHHNSEYHKLSSSIGAKASPQIRLVGHGMIGYKPGKKHSWVKRA